MQEIFGTALFFVVIIIAIFVGKYFSRFKIGITKIPRFIFFFFLAVIGSYLGMVAIGGLLWVISWAGIVLREILQWLIEAMSQVPPYNWILS